MRRLGSGHTADFAEADQTVDDVLDNWRVTPMPA
jgi:hypothetical protein